MKNIKNHNGITLMALVITIIILIILASIGTYSGIQVVKSAQFTAFSTELKIMQTQVNKLYEKKKNNEKILLNNVETDIEDIGTAISSSSEVQTQANKAFNASGITDTPDYKYFDNTTIKNLNIEGVEGEFFVNIDKRSVVSYYGFEYEGKTYYTLEQLPDGLYNVEHNTSEQQPDFNVDYDFLENGNYKITVSDINYIGNINKWNVQFKKHESNTWNESKSNSFNVDTPGTYDIKIANNEYESSVKQLEVVNIYSKISPEVKALLDMGIEIELEDISNIDKLIGLVPTKNDNTNTLSSSIYSREWDAYMAFDKNNNSYWCTKQNQQNDAYIGYDFGKEQFVSHCFYRYGSGYRAKKIKLQCSNDNNTWIDASENVNLTYVETFKLIQNTKVNQGYRYWRIYIISSYSNYSVAHDLQFYNSKVNDIYNLDNIIVESLKNEGIILETDDIISYHFYEKISKLNENLRKQIMSTDIVEKFKNKKIGLINKLNDNENVISSSIYSGSYDAYMAFDKNNGSYWCTASGQQNNAYLGYNFNHKVYIKNVDVFSSAYRCKEVKLQCSNDNNTWIDASDVVTFENNNDIHTIESNIQDTPYQYSR